MYKRILVANRGEIALRIIRACQELGLRTVAIHSTADRDSLHAKLADESICIGPGPSPKSYLRIPLIMSAAEVAGVDAIHPGYRELDNVFLLPHIGSATHETRDAMGFRAISNLVAIFSGAEPGDRVA